MNDFETAIGLEVHVQLSTRTKLFCSCSTAFGNPPNTNICPVCTGLPGALPVPNESALRLALRTALALNCTVNRTSTFERKNYFYPDLPKGYQISQFQCPLGAGGWIEIDMPGESAMRLGITRIHIEEDAGKSLHDVVADRTAIDYNRSGVPLMEIVTEPELSSPREARLFLSSLKQLIEYLEVSDCNMEEGSLRVDANLSTRRAGEALGTKQEIKNLNSFAAVEKTLAELQAKQLATLERGKPVRQVTYSAAAGSLTVIRTKEESSDYRYFPDPDLPPVVIADDMMAAERGALPELPGERRKRFVTQYDIRPYDAAVLTSRRQLADYFEEVVSAGIDGARAAKWIVGPVLADAGRHDGALRIPPHQVARLIDLVHRGTISDQAARKLLGQLEDPGTDPEKLATDLGIVQVSESGAIDAWVEQVCERLPEAVGRFRSGEEKVLGYLIGEVVKLSRGRADPRAVRERLLEKLS